MKELITSHLVEYKITCSRFMEMRLHFTKLAPNKACWPLECHRAMLFLLRQINMAAILEILEMHILLKPRAKKNINNQWVYQATLTLLSLWICYSSCAGAMQQLRIHGRQSVEIRYYLDQQNKRKTLGDTTVVLTEKEMQPLPQKR